MDFKWLAGVFNKNKCPPYTKAQSADLVAGAGALRPFKLMPGRDELELVHGIVFCASQKQAGRMRTETESSVVGGIDTADGHRVAREYELLRMQMAEHPKETVLEKLEAVAFGHGRFEVIHPFMDGNGRIGRLLINHQLNTLGITGGLVSDVIVTRRAAYYKALTAFHDEDDVAPLTNMLSEIVFGKDGPKLVGTKLPRFRPFPFTRNSPYETESSMPDIETEFKATRYTGDPTHPWAKQPTVYNVDL